MSFNGFPKGGLDFLAELARNNRTEWFKANKSRYEELLLNPSREFVKEMGRKLARIAPRINADPRVNQSLFRINRDTRFSKDKTPYKTHAAIWFWEGAGKRMESSGFYFHIEPGEVLLAAGHHDLSPAQLALYRQAVAGEKTGRDLEKAIQKVLAQGPYTVGGSHYKRVPRGFPADHPRAELLKHNGLYAHFQGPPPAELFTPEAVDYCYGIFHDLSPVHLWLQENLP